MITSSPTVVTLRDLNSLETTRTVLLAVNRQGQLPTVLIDPIDTDDRPALGTWIGDGLDGHVYERMIRPDEASDTEN